MQIPKWVWCCLGGLVGMVPMMGATFLNMDQVTCQNHDFAGDVVKTIGSECNP